MSELVFKADTPFWKIAQASHCVIQADDGEYLVINLVDKRTVSSGGSINDAINSARALSFLNDLQQLLSILDEPECVISRGENLSERKLLTEVLVHTQQSFDVQEYLDLGGVDPLVMADIQDAVDRLSSSPVIQDHAGTVITASVFTREVEGEPESEVAAFAVSFRYTGEQLVGIDVRHLDSNYTFAHGRTLIQHVQDVHLSPVHQVFIESEDDSIDWLEVIQAMPLYRQTVGAPENLRRVYVQEGGPVLEYLRLNKPWVVETNADGLPIALRICRVGIDEAFNEEGLQRDIQRMAGLFLEDALQKELSRRCESGLGARNEGVGCTTLRAQAFDPL